MSTIAREARFEVTLRVCKTFGLGGRVFREGDLIQGDDPRAREVLRLKPEAVLVSATRRGYAGGPPAAPKKKPKRDWFSTEEAKPWHLP